MVGGVVSRPRIQSRVESTSLLAEHSHRLAVDVEGGARNEYSLPAVYKEGQRMRHGIIDCDAALAEKGVMPLCLVSNLFQRSHTAQIKGQQIEPSGIRRQWFSS